MTELGAMLQVSLVGYAVGGAFLGLAYFDLYYHVIAIIAIALDLYRRDRLSTPAQAITPAAPVRAVDAPHGGALHQLKKT